MKKAQLNALSILQERLANEGEAILRRYRELCDQYGFKKREDYQRGLTYPEPFLRFQSYDGTINFTGKVYARCCEVDAQEFSLPESAITDPKTYLAGIETKLKSWKVEDDRIRAANSPGARYTNPY